MSHAQAGVCQDLCFIMVNKHSFGFCHFVLGVCRTGPKWSWSLIFRKWNGVTVVVDKTISCLSDGTVPIYSGFGLCKSLAGDGQERRWLRGRKTPVILLQEDDYLCSFQKAQTRLSSLHFWMGTWKSRYLQTWFVSTPNCFPARLTPV